MRSMHAMAGKVEQFDAADDSGQAARFILATGNAGIEAATNGVVRQASRVVLYCVYGAVILLCLVPYAPGARLFAPSCRLACGADSKGGST